MIKHIKIEEIEEQSSLKLRSEAPHKINQSLLIKPAVVAMIVLVKEVPAISKMIVPETPAPAS
ncbi:MAG: hypothetical protein COS49_02000 [Candidatus Portnoybacteria bacterium CG03_land_8_20_14_0_80_41_10]|uniref:Uncharacterized protein n=1 Tax=Candidatus Portnoybacteria bacterium CG03_land_8_20_14_0_80_41_10 TaxID=1974808 RepID=A0A2M7BUC1_9BACT|nr:MAG: hypothetical protein COS49_02000 [Candidatus Portnoybacteria bacterium CG03_land_8_20_14_0_80_41_10]